MGCLLTMDIVSCDGISGLEMLGIIGHHQR